MAPISSPIGSPLPASDPQTYVSSVYSGKKEVTEVWGWNLEEEFKAMVCAAGSDQGAAILALDMEFSGFLHHEPRTGARAVRYQALRENVDQLHPIQMGAAVAGADGSLRGVWSFNLRFDADVDLHTKSSLAFLQAAGLDFPRHASEGIDAAELGRKLSGSGLVGTHSNAPWWITFSGSYDFGYLLKMLTSGRPLPQNCGAFDAELSNFCPRRHELRNELPHGSLDNLARSHGVQRFGAPHTAGSDALLTLELFLRVVGAKLREQRDRWNPWAQFDMTAWNPNNAWGPAWGGRWDNPWLHFGSNPAVPGMLWLPSTLAGPVPSLVGGAPVPSAAFWGSVPNGLAVSHKVADAAAAAQKASTMKSEASKVMEI